MSEQERTKVLRRKRRRLHLRRRIFGTAERPRLAVFRSHKNVYAQVIDDSLGRTLVSASSVSPEVRKLCPSGGNKAAAAVVGKALAEKAVRAGIKRVVFDRGPYPHHGRLKVLADAACEAGLEF